MKIKPLVRVILLAAAVAILAGYFASRYPDGLGSVMKLSAENGYAMISALFGILLIAFIFLSIAKVRRIGEAIKKLLKIG